MILQRIIATYSDNLTLGWNPSLTEICYDSPMTLAFFVTLCCDNFCTKTDPGDKIKYSKIPKNTEIQQENTNEDTKKTTEINCH